LLYGAKTASPGRFVKKARLFLLPLIKERSESSSSGPTTWGSIRMHDLLSGETCPADKPAAISLMKRQ
jgi:hypothetical protein